MIHKILKQNKTNKITIYNINKKLKMKKIQKKNKTMIYKMNKTIIY